MIRLALFDVGNTLIGGSDALPHVGAALARIAELKCADGQPLVLGVVSDFGLAPPDAGEEILAEYDADFVARLRAAGLDSFFRPVAERVTLSTRAGVEKPDRRIFELACRRSGTGAGLAECLFVTEWRPHIVASRALGMTTIGFRAGADWAPSFDDWRDAPELIASFVSSR
jgi:FMN phosphatase YigB (HAD superfamily)